MDISIEFAPTASQGVTVASYRGWAIYHCERQGYWANGMRRRPTKQQPRTGYATLKKACQCVDKRLVEEFNRDEPNRWPTL